MRRLLDVLHAEIETLIKEYSAILRAIISVDHDPDHAHIFTDAEREISAQIEQLHRCSALRCVELQQVLVFLTDVHAVRSSGPATHARCSFESAHGLALYVFKLVRQMWQKCTEVADRSQWDRSYLYATTAAKLFATTWIAKNDPQPQELWSLVSIEYHAARQELDRRSHQQPHPQVHAQHVHVSGEVVTVSGVPDHGVAATSKAPRPAIEPFPTPAGAGWSDVSIRFTDGHTVLVRVRDIHRTVNYTQMGMNDARSGRPDQQWGLMQTFAQNRGLLTWDLPGAHPKNQKRKEVLASNLKAFMRLADDPFEIVPGGWRAKFGIEPDA